MHKPSGARIEVFCLEPHAPADYERAFAVVGRCAWSLHRGQPQESGRKGHAGDRLRRSTARPEHLRRGYRTGNRRPRADRAVRVGGGDLTFGQLLELPGTDSDSALPEPRQPSRIDYTRYQTVYSKFEGSVAAPTAGLHFTPELIAAAAGAAGVGFEEVTLHVGAGTFLPVKDDDAARPSRCTPSISRCGARRSPGCWRSWGRIVGRGHAPRCARSNRSRRWRGAYVRAGTPDADAGRSVSGSCTTCRRSFPGARRWKTLLKYMDEKGLGTHEGGDADHDYAAGVRVAASCAMIVTNFHQPKSTLLLLVSAFVGGDWKQDLRIRPPDTGSVS